MIIRGNHANSNGSIPPVFNPATIVLNPLGTSKTGDDVVALGYNKIVELGESVDITLAGTITPNDETQIDNRIVEIDQGAESGFTFQANAYSLSDAGLLSQRSYQSKADVNNNGTPTTITSIMRSILFQLPVLYGNITDLNETPENLYTALTVKMGIQNQTISLTFPAHASGYHKVIALPDAWGAITHIIKDGQWEQIGSFVTIAKTITKTGAWTESYTMYATNVMNAMSETTYQIQF